MRSTVAVIIILVVSITPMFAMTPHDTAPLVHVGRILVEKEQHTAKSASSEIAGANRPTIYAGSGNEALEADEFWPLIWGKKIKITDSAIVLLTLVLAVSTIVLAIKTAGLDQSTRRLFQAGERQIALSRLALESAETPYLVPVVKAFNPASDPPPPGRSSIGLVSYRFRNCGRSPAMVLEIFDGLVASSSLPREVSFPPPQTNLMHSPTLSTDEISEARRFSEASVHSDWSRSDQERAAWLIGQIRYADVFGNQFITGYCFYRNGWSNSWIAQGTRAHNYRRKLTPAEVAIAEARDRLFDPSGQQL